MDDSEDYDNTICLPEPSLEQSEIIKSIRKCNVLVDAVAGAGKTTTICLIAKNQPSKKILLLTYNKRLKHETHVRVKKNNILNVTVHNYHSFCFNKYSISGNTDQMILDALKKYADGTHKYTPHRYDIIVIDEAQDLTPLYVELIKLILVHNVKRPKLCIIGDVRQTIYGFNGADERFLIYAKTIFNINDLPWKQLNLSTSYRISRPMCNFLNKCILKQDLIVSGKENGYKPRYIFCDAFGTGPIEELMTLYINKYKYKYSDIFILAPSIQSDLSPIKMFANTLSAEHNVPIFIPTSDNEKLTSKSTDDKLVFATFHQVKGLERKCVIIFGFDNSYYYYYNNDGRKDVCPNEIYVGLTRCTERMSIIHHYRKNFINFIDDKKIDKYCYCQKIGIVGLELEYFTYRNINLNLRVFDYINEKRAIDIIMENNDIRDSLNKEVKLSVTKLLSHIPINIINEALSFIEIVKIINICTNTKIKSPLDSDESNEGIEETIQNDKFIVHYMISDLISENVSEIVGTAIPIIYEYKKTKRLPIKRYIEQNLLNKPYNTGSIYNVVKKKYHHIKNLKKLRSSDIFELTTIHLALSNNTIHKLNQISKYNFLNADTIKLCMKRLDNHVSRNAEFEIYREHSVTLEIEGIEVPVKRIVYGYIDCIDNSTLWEFKTVQELQRIHILQLAIYAYLFQSNYEINKEFKLLNINDGEKYVIKGNILDFRNVFEYVYRYKFTKPVKISDEEFIINQSIYL